MNAGAAVSEGETEMTSGPAAGWYDDPTGDGLRYWDGGSWTEHTSERPVEPPPPSQPAAGPPPPPPGYAISRAGQQPEQPDAAGDPVAAEDPKTTQMSGSAKTVLGILIAIVVLVGLGYVMVGHSNKQSKMTAQDADAKSALRTAQTAIETYATDFRSYEGATTSMLITYEPTLTFDLRVADTSEDSYELVWKSESGNVFRLSRNSEETTYECSEPGRGGCPESGEWA